MEDNFNQILEDTETLCSVLSNDYITETTKNYKKLISDQIDVRQNEMRLRKLSNPNFPYGKFIVSEGRKYYKVLHILSDEENDTHCFIDRTTGEVYRPHSEATPYKKRSYTLDHCIKHADWRGYYLKNVTI